MLLLQHFLQTSPKRQKGTFFFKSPSIHLGHLVSPSPQSRGSGPLNADHLDEEADHQEEEEKADHQEEEEEADHQDEEIEADHNLPDWHKPGLHN